MVFLLISHTQGRTMGQEWRLYDVGGARNTVRYNFFNTLLPCFNFGVREGHGIPTLMMVG